MKLINISTKLKEKFKKSTEQVIEKRKKVNKRK